MKVWLRPLPFALLGAYALSRVGQSPVDDAAPSRSAALCDALLHDNVACVPEDVVWLDGPSGVRGATFGRARALVRARPEDEILDIFAVDARLSPEGQLLDVGGVHNLTRTTGADEGRPVVSGALAAYVVRVDGQPQAVHVLDLDGHDRSAYDELSRFQKWQVAIADKQLTGRRRGVKKTVFALVPPPEQADLAFRPDGLLEVKSDDRTLIFDARAGAVVDGIAHVRVTPEIVSKPPTFAPWMSDRLRAIPWFGDEKNQALKAIVFTAIEWAKGVKSRVTGDTGESEVEEDLASLNEGNVEPVTYVDPEIGWPPAPLEPLLTKPIAGEGHWISLEKDPFITPIPGMPAPFLTTFVRTDPSAVHTRVYITLWDPRLVALHMEAGTVEPVSSTGEAGTGQIPRTPERIRHVVAGFNGGFQATHGEYGMQANGVLYLPPKPYGATVLELRDGTTAFGSWPGPVPKDAPAARSWSEVPDEVLSFRQNMNALVDLDKYNPWNRSWWGGVPPGWQDRTHTTRSGLCLTKEGFVAYFWGSEIGPEPLGRAMLLARCAYGMHLDMNPGLAGFEFYNVQPAERFEPLGRPLQKDWEVEGTIKDMPEFKYRARRMIKSMGHILFPRYLQRDARDFFYLTTRAVLPGPPLETREGAAAPWRVKGLPQHGYPYALALSSTRLGEHETDKRVRVLRIDPRTVRAEREVGGPGSDTAPVVATFGRPARAKPEADKTPPAARETLWLGARVFSIERTAPAGSMPIVGIAPREAGFAARAAAGISDEDGMLQWVELLPEDEPDARTNDALLGLLERLGCAQRGLVEGDVRAFPGGSLDLAAEPAVPSEVTARLVRAPAPVARRYFESTEVLPQSVWHPLMAQRVIKWRPTKAPPEVKEPKPTGSATAPR
jgi:hypothetical protein